jgi:hypothetical protein
MVITASSWEPSTVLFQSNQRINIVYPRGCAFFMTRDAVQMYILNRQ